MSDLPALTLLNAVRAERDAALARAKIAEHECTGLALTLNGWAKRSNGVEAKRDALSSRLREAEGIIRGLLRVVENWSDEERAIRADAQRFLSASPTPTEEGR